MKVYEYTDDSWLDDNGCDCCEPHLMPCYNLLNSDDLYYCYSCHSEEDCYRQVLEIEGILDEEYEFVEDYDGGILKQLCEDNDIEVIVHYEEGLEED